MGKSYLDSDEILIGNRWLKTIFFPAVNGNLDAGYIGYRTYSRNRVVDSCVKIYTFISTLAWDTNNDMEPCFEFLAKGNAVYKINPKEGDLDENLYTLTKNQLYRVIANLCAKCEIFWDDTQHTPEELRYFISTPMGKALWDFRCFVSQEPNVISVKTPSSSTRSASSSGSSTGVASSGSKLNIQNAGGLVNNTKETISNPEVYWICGEFTNPGKTKPRIHVSPLNQASPLKVKFGSGQGFDDCILYFSDYSEANAFMGACDANKPSNVANLSVKRVKTDTNGYFRVHTQFGDAYIKASKLHEMLEALEENTVDYFEQTRLACEALEEYLR